VAPPVRRFVVLGGGGHGRVVADLVRALGHEVVGYADADRGKLGLRVDAAGGRVVMTQDELLACAAGRMPWALDVDAVALGIGDNSARDRVRALLPSALLPPLVHPTAWVSPSASLGSGTVVLPGAVVHTQARVGEAVVVNSRAVVEHDCDLADAVHVSPGAVLCGGVVVGTRSWVAAGAVIVPLRRIGRDSVVGAGAVVVRDVADEVTVVGNPARELAAASRAASLVHSTSTSDAISDP
jgi:sugar O-acyltransferase (sialic acid O-acetyltransferase NeuD family)